MTELIVKTDVGNVVLMPGAADLLREAASTLRVVYAPVLVDMTDDAYTALDIAEPLADLFDRCAASIEWCERQGMAEVILDELRVLAEKIGTLQ